MFQGTILKLLLIFLLASLSSFSLVPIQKKNDQLTVEQKKQQQQYQRLQKRHTRLLQRFEKAKNSQKRLRLQQKIRQVEQQQADKPSPLLAILGLSLGVLAVLTLIIVFYTQILATTLLVFLFSLIGLLLAVGGTVVSAFALSKIKSERKKHGGVGFAIAGFLVSCGIIGLFLLLFLFSGGSI
ncbi:MAG: hypothetical protein AB8E82_17975 [Aureispira sp.]